MPDKVSASSPAPRLWTYLLTLFTAALFLKHMTQFMADPDLWGYMAFGRTFLESGSFPYADVFAYTPTLNPWVYHEWLSGVVFYPLYHTWGGAGLQSLKYLLGFSTLILIFIAALRRGGSPVWILLTLILAGDCLALGYSPVRAQLFTYLFFACALLLMDTAVRTRRYAPLWLLPVMMLLWCNLHGGFVAGLGGIGLYGAGQFLAKRPWKPFLAPFFASLLIIVLNPYGFQYIQYILEAVSMPRPTIVEWLSVPQAIARDGLNGVPPSVLAMLALAIPLLLWRLYRRDVSGALLLGATAWMGFAHIRHLVLFAIVFTVTAPSAASRVWQLCVERISPFLVKIAPYAVALFLIALFWPLPQFLYRHFQNNKFFTLEPLSYQDSTMPGFYYPIELLRYMERQQLFGNVLCEFTWGEYFLWRLSPQSAKAKVAMDGRYETVYPPDVASGFFTFNQGKQGWTEYLHAYEHQMVAFKAGSKVDMLMRHAPDWWEVFRDQGSVLFVHAGFRPHGKGRRSWPGGARYEGEYRQGKPHGQGVYHWPDGTEYRGAFADGVGHGRGELRYSDGRVVSGLFEHGKLVEEFE